MDDLIKLKKEIFANGIIDDADVNELRDFLFAGEGINKEKANFLFEIKDTVNKSKFTKSLERLFIDAISSFLLDDDTSPGEIDENEAKWLRAKIQNKGYADRIDKKLLANLLKTSINFPEILQYKHQTIKTFETLLFGLRFVTFFAVIGSMLASVVLFIRSSIQVYEGLKFFIINVNSTQSQDLEHLVAQFVASIDGYLFAMILIIFSMGIYELFINKIDPVSRRLDKRPSWLQINSIDELKMSLGKVILMILIVSFFEHSLSLKYESIMDLLLLGIGILLISAALFLTHAREEHKDKKEKNS